LLEVVLEEKRREIIKEWIKKGKYNVNKNGFQL
jgi:polyhydroxyalkanoate synthesis regulator phasin